MSEEEEGGKKGIRLRKLEKNVEIRMLSSIHILSFMPPSALSLHSPSLSLPLPSHLYGSFLFPLSLHFLFLLLSHTIPSCFLFPPPIYSVLLSFTGSLLQLVSFPQTFFLSFSSATHTHTHTYVFNNTPTSLFPSLYQSEMSYVRIVTPYYSSYQIYHRERVLFQLVILSWVFFLSLPVTAHSLLYYCPTKCLLPLREGGGK